MLTSNFRCQRQSFDIDRTNVKMCVQHHQHTEKSPTNSLKGERSSPHGFWNPTELNSLVPTSIYGSSILLHFGRFSSAKLLSYFLRKYFKNVEFLLNFYVFSLKSCTWIHPGISCKLTDLHRVFPRRTDVCRCQQINRRARVLAQRENSRYWFQILCKKKWTRGTKTASTSW